MIMTARKPRNRRGPVVRNKMRWRIKDHEFEDGSTLANWTKIEGSSWLPQEEGYELSFDIYEHDGQFWKLYIARWKAEDQSKYAYSYGGVACRMAQVAYKKQALSPHSGVEKPGGELEWVRVEEVDNAIHQVIRKGGGYGCGGVVA